MNEHELIEERVVDVRYKPLGINLDSVLSFQRLPLQKKKYAAKYVDK